jgi:hypothetical protein
VKASLDCLLAIINPKSAPREKGYGGVDEMLTFFSGDYF